MSKTIEFDGDPMLQLENFKDLSQYIFYLNNNALEEIKSYSMQCHENIPSFFSEQGILYNYVLLAEGGIDENGNEFPDTFISIEEIEDNDIAARISGIYAEDIKYKAPASGQHVILKKNSYNKGLK